jgi:hypothetical protein
MPNTVILKGDPIFKEGVAGEAITPGDLLEWFAGPDRLMRHSSQDGPGMARIAIEDKAQAGEVGTAYVSGATTQYVVGRAGDEYWMWLVASGTAVKGDLLTSNGDGALKVNNADPDALFEAAEDLTAGGSETRIRVEVR